MLTNEQNNVLQTVIKGHNTLITGQAGTGKSYLVEEIFKSLHLRGKGVALVCSSGFSGTVYINDGIRASTVHSFYGLRTGELPWEQLINRCLSDKLVRKRIKKLDCLIWDEASISICRMLELLNKLHLELTTPYEGLKPFNGVQIIIVGEFLQLKPVPSILMLANLCSSHLCFSGP